MFVGGWQLSTILTATSGGWGTVTTGADNALSGIGGQIANLVGNPYGSRARFGANGYLVASAFAAPPLGTYSLQRPLSVHGPASYELDMGISRNFKVPHREADQVQFRWEVFNVPNEAIFTSVPAGAITGSTFGTFTSATAGAPRIMQGALKYIF